MKSLLYPPLAALAWTCVCYLTGDKQGAQVLGATTLITAAVAFGVAAVCECINEISEDDQP